MLKAAYLAVTASIVLVLPSVGLGQSTPAAEGLKFDTVRGVYSLASALEPVMPGIVQILVQPDSVEAPAREDDRRRRRAPRDMYRDQDEDRTERPRRRDRRQDAPTPDRTIPGHPFGYGPVGFGSGVVIDAIAGLIITNNHVIDNSRKIVVRVTDGRDLPAELIGRDPSTDIALLKVKADDLVEVALADSESLKVGDLVVAVGFPFGRSQTATMGIISGLGRTGVGTDYEDFIQTDAAINKGNSGGALLDSQGRLIGINTAIFSELGVNIGIGYAVPARMAMAVVAQLKEFGEVRRGRLGIEMQALTTDLAVALGIDGTSGVLVTRVDSGSAGETAGLKPGDVIVLAAGQRIDHATDLRNVIGLAIPDRSFDMEILRDRQPLTLSVALAPPATDAKTALTFAGADLGVLPDSNPMSKYVDGLLVIAIDASSPAASAGLRKGDVIVDVNRRGLEDAKSVTRSLRRGGTTTVLTVARGNQELIVVIRG